MPEYECEPCHYHQYIHDYKNPKVFEKLEKCRRCMKPIRDRLEGHGIYAEGGITIPEDMCGE